MAKLERGSVGAMRVVVLDPDPEIRKILHETIGESPEFLLVDEPRTWKECKALLDIYLPELLIVRTGTATPNISKRYLNRRHSCGFYLDAWRARLPFLGRFLLAPALLTLFIL